MQWSNLDTFLGQRWSVAPDLRPLFLYKKEIQSHFMKSLIGTEI